MTFTCYVLYGENLKPNLNMYIEIYAISSKIPFLVYSSLPRKYNTNQPEFDKDERHPIIISYLRPTSLVFRIMEPKLLFDPTIIHEGKIKLLDLRPDTEIPVDLSGSVKKSKPARLFFKILPTIPRNIMRDWHLRDHTLYISLEYDQKADALRKPPASLDLVSVDSIKHRIRIFGGARKPEKWIKYHKKPVFISENGPTNVFRICTKRAPKQAFIPLVNVNRHVEGNMHIKFWACCKESKDYDHRKLNVDNLYPQLILDDVIEIDGPGKYSAGHVYMQESKRPPKFIPFKPRQLAFRESLIDFAKHFGPMVFESYPSWQVDFLDNEIE